MNTLLYYLLYLQSMHLFLVKTKNYRSVPLEAFLYKSTPPVPQDMQPIYTFLPDTKGLCMPVQYYIEKKLTMSRWEWTLVKFCTNAFFASVSGIRSRHVHKVRSVYGQVMYTNLVSQSSIGIYGTKLYICTHPRVLAIPISLPALKRFWMLNLVL